MQHLLKVMFLFIAAVVLVLLFKMNQVMVAIFTPTHRIDMSLSFVICLAAVFFWFWYHGKTLWRKWRGLKVRSFKV